MTIEGIDHVQLAMPPGGEDQARRFYGQLLGIAEVPKPPALAERGGCWFENDRVKLHVGVEQDFRPAKKAHPALLASDRPSLVDTLRGAGVDVTSDGDQVYVHDPFGNRLELVERH